MWLLAQIVAASGLVIGGLALTFTLAFGWRPNEPRRQHRKGRE